MTLISRYLLLGLLVLAVALSARAQTEYPRIEVFGGYSYASIDNVGFSGTRQNSHGWAASASVNVHKYFGLTANFAGQYGDVNPVENIALLPCPDPRLVPPPLFCIGQPKSFSTHQFLFGPRVTVRGERITGFGHVLLGWNYLHGSGFDVGGMRESRTDFAVALGGGLDVNAGKRLAVRVVQVDYLPVRAKVGGFIGGDHSVWLNHVRLQSGVVVKLGAGGQTPADVGSQGEYPRAEVFAGYSFMRVERFAFPSREAAHGWATSASLNFHRHFGVVADFAGQYGDAEPEVFPFPIGCIQVFPPSITCVGEPRGFSNYQFLVGPRVTGRTNHLTAFGHVLFGGNYIRGSGFAVTDFLRLSSSSSEFAVALGGGLDLNAGRHFAIRIAQVDYLPVRDSGRFWTDNLRLESGVVFKFGGH